MLDSSPDDSMVTRLGRETMRGCRGSLRGVLLALAALSLYVVSPALLAGPQREQQAEPIVNATVPDPASRPTADSPASHSMPIHHPPGDLTGSYTLNTPTRPGFWIAAAFTGVVTLTLIATLVLVRPKKRKRK